MKRDAIRWIAFFAAVKLLFHFWSNGLQGRARGYGDPPPRTVIALGFDRKSLERHFSDVVPAGLIPNPFGLENGESERPEIYVCRGLREPSPEFWRLLRSFG